jgi:hypothetical protein
MAEQPSRIWFGLQHSRGGISRRAMRLSVRHLGGLIYNVVDDFVRGRNVTGLTKRNHSSRCEMRFKPWAPFAGSLPDQFLAKSESALSL